MLTFRDAATTATALAILQLAACGTSSTPSPSSSALATNGGEELKSASAIMADTYAAFANIKAAHLTITVTDKSGTSKDTLDLTQTTAQLSAAVGVQQQTFVLVVGGKVYSHPGIDYRAATPAESMAYLALLPAKEASCNAEQHGAFTKGGISTINGRRAIEIKDDGNSPGAAPGSTFIALEGDPLPVRAISTGPTRPGGDKSCGSVDDSTMMAEQIDFAYPDSVPHVTAPPLPSPT